MPYLDIIIALPIAWGLFQGFRKGFIIEICTLMALVIGVYGASTFGETAGEYLQEHYNTDPQLSLVLAFAILFIIIVVVVFIFGKMLEGVIKLVALGLVNKIFGLLFGGLKFAIIVSAVLYLITGFPGTEKLISQEWKKDSYLYEPVSAIATTIYPVLDSHKWYDELHDQLDGIKDSVIN